MYKYEPIDILCKREYPDAVVLIQVGEFFESFNECAKVVSRVLGLPLTELSESKWYNCIAGFPQNKIDANVRKLSENGHRVIIVWDGQDVNHILSPIYHSHNIFEPEPEILGEVLYEEISVAQLIAIRLSAPQLKVKVSKIGSRYNVRACEFTTKCKTTDTYSAKVTFYYSNNAETIEVAEAIFEEQYQRHYENVMADLREMTEKSFEEKYHLTHSTTPQKEVARKRAKTTSKPSW